MRPFRIATELKKKHISKKSNTFSLVKSTTIYLPFLKCRPSSDHFTLDIDFILKIKQSFFHAPKVSKSSAATKQYYAALSLEKRLSSGGEGVGRVESFRRSYSGLRICFLYSWAKIIKKCSSSFNLFLYKVCRKRFFFLSEVR